MRVFQEVTVQAPRDIHEAFISEVASRLSEGWYRDKALEAGPILHMTVYYFANHDLRDFGQVLLALSSSKLGLLHVSNIIARARQQLTYDEYNSILVAFANNYLVPTANERGFVVSISPSDQSIDDWLSPECAAALRRFSISANKSTGTSHPMDKERWFEFVILAANAESTFDSTLLKRWLIEEGGWHPDIADEIVIEYEQQIELISYMANRGL